MALLQANVLPGKDESKMISNDYVLIQRRVDDKTRLAPEDMVIAPERKNSVPTGKKKRNNLENRKSHSNSQLFYVLLDLKAKALFA